MVEAKPKILFVNNLYAPNIIGGAERSVQFLAEALAAKGHPVTVLTLAPQTAQPHPVDRPIERPIEHHGVTVRYLPLRNLYWAFHNKDNPTLLKPWWHVIDSYNLLMGRAVSEVLAEERPDVVHSNVLTGFSVAAWTAIKRHNLPLVHTLRDYYLMCPRSKMFRRGKNCRGQCWDCKLYAAPRQALSNQVDAVIGISRFVLERHLNAGYFATSPLKAVIHNTYQADAPPVPLRTGSTLRLGYLGRLEANKGIEQLLETITPMQDVSLYVAGRGHESFETNLKRRFAAPHIHYLGFIPPAELFAKIDVLVVPSLWHEPLGRIVFEAYAHGLPVIATDRGGISEIVSPGETGFLFDPDVPESDERSLERTITAFKQHADTEVMRQHALTKAKDFLPHVIVEQHEALYERVLASPETTTNKA